MLLLVGLIYRQVSLWKPTDNLLTLIPENPICFVSAKNLADAVKAFTHSQFGQRAAQMPILAEIQGQRWWRKILYQKQLWEHEIGGTLNFNKLKGYFGEEAILALYRRKGEISFLLISVVGAKEKLEIAAVTATDAFNPTYKRLQNEYEGFTINTITGYPRDFSYAFIGNIGLLALHQSLIENTIDIYTKRKEGFNDVYPMRQSLQKRYNSDGSIVFVNFPVLFNAFETVRELVPLGEEIETWTFSNGYHNGTIRSHHRMQWAPDRERRAPEPATINPNLLSILPATSAMSYIDRTINPSILWQLSKSNLSIRHELHEVELTRHLGEEVALALVDAASGGAIRVPSVIAAIPITNRSGLDADLKRLRGHRIVVNGKQLKFSESQSYRGVAFQPVQLPLGFLFSLKGAYALSNDYWIISTTVSGLKSTIDTLTGKNTALTQLRFPEPANQPRNCHLLIQPDLLISEVKGFMPILSLMAPIMGNTFDFSFMRQVIANSSALETLGPVSVGVDFDDGGMEVDVQVVVTVGDKS